MDTQPGLHRIAAMQARDAALALVSKVNVWLISAAVLVAVGLTALTAHAFHAKAATTTPASGQSSSSAASPAPSSSDDSSSGVTPPANNPVPAMSAPQPVAPVVSGGS